MREYSSEQLLEFVSGLLAKDLDDGYELTQVDTAKDVSQQTREITIILKNE